ncbi:Hsp33 family molecular chaperone HslO [Clostridium sp. 19966]|uniref:Hsp33 family molecular chaperone HslO n=1 Tax=Clostridium sp. 19966 TaxID=2768166 RepID=UPI0028DDC5C6|nr:Hsp33 family molecular chaperone HslO [Clostridium sp. 19966]MDT8716531.1 Hsp33 family molecular chaperone HslO [Clostridium sp. 19966]
MGDKLIIGTASNAYVRIIAAETTELVKEACKIHNCSATASAALGRMATAGALMGAMLKNDKDVLTLQVNGKGIAGNVVVTAYSNGNVKGYIGNPSADLPPNSKGKLDVGGIIGTDGNLTVIKDMGLRDPYVGQIPLVSGEIGDDLTYYFAMSEQTPSAVALGVLVDKDLSVLCSGGFIIQMMPGADELLADLLTYRIQEMPHITSMLTSGKTIEDVVSYVFEDIDFKIQEQRQIAYECDCNREKVEKALISIGKKDLQEIYEEGKTEELKCHFCNKSYSFTHEQIGEILKNI